MNNYISIIINLRIFVYYRKTILVYCFSIIVKFENGIEWMPALVDLGDILSKIGTCEDMKYSQGQGYKYTQKFIIECFTKKRREIEQLYNDQFNPNNLKYSK